MSTPLPPPTASSSPSPDAGNDPFGNKQSILQNTALLFGAFAACLGFGVVLWNVRSYTYARRRTVNVQTRGPYILIGLVTVVVALLLKTVAECIFVYFQVIRPTSTSKLPNISRFAFEGSNVFIYATVQSWLIYYIYLLITGQASQPSFRAIRRSQTVQTVRNIFITFLTILVIAETALGILSTVKLGKNDPIPQIAEIARKVWLSTALAIDLGFVATTLGTWKLWATNETTEDGMLADDKGMMGVTVPITVLRDSQSKMERFIKSGVFQSGVLMTLVQGCALGLEVSKLKDWWMLPTSIEPALLEIALLLWLKHYLDRNLSRRIPDFGTDSISKAGLITAFGPENDLEKGVAFGLPRHASPDVDRMVRETKKGNNNKRFGPPPRSNSDNNIVKGSTMPPSNVIHPIYAAYTYQQDSQQENLSRPTPALAHPSSATLNKNTGGPSTPNGKGKGMVANPTVSRLQREPSLGRNKSRWSTSTGSPTVKPGLLMKAFKLKGSDSSSESSGFKTPDNSPPLPQNKLPSVMMANRNVALPPPQPSQPHPQLQPLNGRISPETLPRRMILTPEPPSSDNGRERNTPSPIPSGSSSGITPPVPVQKASQDPVLGLVARRRQNQPTVALLPSQERIEEMTEPDTVSGGGGTPDSEKGNAIAVAAVGGNANRTESSSTWDLERYPTDSPASGLKNLEDGDDSVINFMPSAQAALDAGGKSNESDDDTLKVPKAPSKGSTSIKTFSFASTTTNSNYSQSSG